MIDDVDDDDSDDNHRLSQFLGGQDIFARKYVYKNEHNARMLHVKSLVSLICCGSVPET